MRFLLRGVIDLVLAVGILLFAVMLHLSLWNALKANLKQSLAGTAYRPNWSRSGRKHRIRF